MTNFSELITKIPGQLMVALVLGFCFWGFVPNGNEEHYLLLAKSFYNPAWLNIESEFPGTRIIFQWMVGPVVNYWGFEWTTAIIRLLLIFGFGYILSKFYKTLEFGNYQILLHLAVLFLGHQSFFAGSAALLGVETKSFAYILVFLSFYLVFIKSYYWLAFSLILATYFHFLVGMYSSFYIFFTLLIVQKDKRTVIIKSGFIYILLILPFVFYLLQATQIPSSNQHPSASWIYTYFRHPHHTALFQDVKYFYQNHFYGILFAAIGAYFLQLCGEQREWKWEFIRKFSLVSLAYTLALVPLSFFDKEGIYLKYYPYRINTLSTFMLGVFVIHWIYQNLTLSVDSLKVLNKSVLALSMVFIFKMSLENMVITSRYLSADKAHLYSFIKKETPKDAVVMNMTSDQSFMRRAERKSFVEYKFVPAELSKINDWYDKVIYQNEVEVNPDKLLNNTLEVDYLVSERTMPNSDRINLVFENQSFFVYKIKKNSQ